MALSAGWDDTYYLDLTARNDWSSARSWQLVILLSLGLGKCIARQRPLKLHDSAPWIDMLKIRGSWANVSAHDTNPYTLTVTHTRHHHHIPQAHFYPITAANTSSLMKNVERAGK